LTEQELQQFGQALAERYVQVREEHVLAERRFREAFYSPISKRVDVLELERKSDIAKATFGSWQEVTDTLPLEIREVFNDHIQKIKPMEAK
jgi:hypothetical protein